MGWKVNTTNYININIRVIMTSSGITYKRRVNIFIFIQYYHYHNYLIIVNYSRDNETTILLHVYR